MQVDDAPRLALTRRSLLAGGAAVAACPTIAIAAARFPDPALPDLTFKVARNGHDIGAHTLRFDRSGNSLRVHIAADFRIGLGFITLFRYRHRGLEEWRDGQFVALDTETDSNGSKFHVHAQRTNGGIAIQATGLPDQLVSGDALPLTHWSEAAMRAPVFNPQTGKMLHEIVRPEGIGTITLASGQPIQAKRYAMAGEAPIEDWYDTSGTWAALNATAADGSAIAYRRL
jgi:hypothetical protein